MCIKIKVKTFHSSIIWKNPKLETIQMKINRIMDKLWYAYTIGKL